MLDDLAHPVEHQITNAAYRGGPLILKLVMRVFHRAHLLPMPANQRHASSPARFGTITKSQSSRLIPLD
jgi:hypothetical protein